MYVRSKYNTPSFPVYIFLDTAVIGLPGQYHSTPWVAFLNLLAQDRMCVVRVVGDTDAGENVRRLLFSFSKSKKMLPDSGTYITYQ